MDFGLALRQTGAAGKPVEPVGILLALPRRERLLLELLSRVLSGRSLGEVGRSVRKRVLSPQSVLLLSLAILLLLLYLLLVGI